MGQGQMKAANLMPRKMYDEQGNIIDANVQIDYQVDYNKESSFKQFIVNNWMWMVLVIVVLLLFYLMWDWTSCGKVKIRATDTFEKISLFNKSSSLSSDPAMFAYIGNNKN